MTTYIEYNVLKQLNDDFLKNIKIIFFFGHKVSEVLIVTKDETVFGFGQNDSGVLGFGHNRQVFEPKIIEELSRKRIIRFVNGLYHVIGLTNDGKIYSWGRNAFSQLGNGIRNNDFNKPEINEYLIDEVIVDMSCGAHHSIVLTEKNELYVWGYNDSGQIGNNNKELFQSTPFKLKAFRGENIVAVSSGFSHSLALTDKGHVFSWGSNCSGQLGIEENDGTYSIFKTITVISNKPLIVKMKSDSITDVFIVKISCGCFHTMLLSSDGIIYTCGDNDFGQIGNNSTAEQMTFQKINSSIKYKDIASHSRYNISIAVSVDNIHYIWGKFGEKAIKFPEQSKFNSINDILLTYNGITHGSNQILYDFETLNNCSLDYEKIVKKNTINKIIRRLFSKKNNKIIQVKECLNHFSLLFSAGVIAKYRKEIRIEANFIKNMKISFQFYDRDDDWPHIDIGINKLFVTEGSKIFASGSNSDGLLGFNHKNAIDDSMIVKELCDKGIIDFANGFRHVIARTNNNQLYIWGYNTWGQLGNETHDDCFVPQLVEALSDKYIIDICCGKWHSLALTESGELYAWGWNKFGQTGSGSEKSSELKPLKIQEIDDQNIIAISCGSYHSLALTKSGRVYSWGGNSWGQLGFTEIIVSNKPKRIKIKNNNELKIKEISCGSNYSLLLTSEGDIYGFGSNSFGQLGNKCFENHFIPTKIMNENKFNEIASHKEVCLSAALSTDGIYYIWGFCGQIMTEPKKTQFDSFNNIFLNYYGITNNRTQTDSKYGTNFLLPIEQKSYYKRHFEEFGLIASGNYGLVSKAKNNKENEICAIKRIALNVKNKDLVFKELQIMGKLNCDFVVKVKKYWIEDNYLLEDDFEQFKDSGIESLSGHQLFDPKNDLLLHIQMELCFKSLKQIIKVINNKLNSNFEQIITQIYYYISSELLIEIVECVDYLHKQDPPIIHRDLKPANILITHGINGRFVKLCDFGLAKLHKFDEQSHTTCVGTIKYMAPEVLRAQKYNIKADIYSLALVVQDLIKYFEEQIEAKSEITVFRKYKNLSALVDDMMKVQELRPNCELILNQKNSWALSISEFGNEALLEEISKNSFSIEENFHSFFIKKKLEILKKLKHSNT